MVAQLLGVTRIEKNSNRLVIRPCNGLPAYLPFVIYGFRDMGKWVYVFSTPNPVIAFIRFFIANYMFRMSKNRTIHLMLTFYLLSLLLMSISRGVSFCFFQQAEGPYNYMLDAGAAMVSAVVCIKTLNDAVTDFRAIKHDFYNILGTYSRYISIDDYEGLKRYHEKLLCTTVVAGEQLDIARKMDQNPALCSLLIQKSERAEQRGAVMNISLLCPIDNISMDNFDLCRTITNAVKGDIDVSKITALGYTTPDIVHK